jgi:hypothetical protein
MGAEMEWPTRPHPLRRHPRPPLERPHEALLVLKPHLGCDLFDGALRAQQQVGGLVVLRLCGRGDAGWGVGSGFRSESQLPI